MTSAQPLAEAGDPVAAAIEDARWLLRQRNAATATQRLSSLTRRHPDSVPARAALADAYLSTGHYAPALGHFETVLDAEPGNLDWLIGLATCLARRPGLALRLRSPGHLEACLTTVGVDPDLVAAATAALVRHSPDPLRHSLLSVLLHRVPVVDLDLERIVAAERRRLCLEPPASAPPLASAIAAQGVLNQQAWPVSPDEESALATAADWVRAMYELDAPDGELVARAGLVPSLSAAGTTRSRATSGAVRDLYEAHPYPRWRELTRRRPYDLGEHLRAIAEGSWDPPSALGRPRLLAAGCGTGRELLGAVSAWAPMEATGIDLSRTSLAHAERMAERLGLEVSFYQADLLDLAAWDRSFDVIICTGVLHHLADPVAGWRILTGLLRPGGVMLVGLYSATARRGITRAQEQVRLLGVPPTAAGIRAARAHLSDLPEHHPARQCASLSDFYTVGGCRDLLFHVQERHFSLPEIANALDGLGLVFRGFEVDPAVRHLMASLFGSSATLEHWDAFERLFPATFLGMYQFWCQRAEPCSGGSGA